MVFRPAPILIPPSRVCPSFLPSLPACRPLKQVLADVKDELYDPISNVPCEPMRTRLGALYEGYEPRYFWWESVEMIRKLVLCSLLQLVSPGTATQLALALTITARAAPLRCGLHALGAATCGHSWWGALHGCMLL